MEAKPHEQSAVFTMSSTYRVNQYYEDGYDTGRGVENEHDIFETWTRASELARKSLNCQLAVPYGDANRETIDLFFAEGSTRWLVFIHGGYWRGFTGGHFHFLVQPFLDAGWNVAFPEYDLCPVVTIHRISEQCRRAIAWLSQNYAEQCTEMVISGHSAGGHLTGMMFATDWAAYGMSSELIIGGIAISSLFDLDPIAQTERNRDLKLSVADVQQLSPARLLPQVNAPLVLTVGSLESSEFHRQNEILRGVPQWQAICSETLSLEGYHHFNILDDLMALDGVMWSKLREMGADIF